MWPVMLPPEDASREYWTLSLEWLRERILESGRVWCCVIKIRLVCQKAGPRVSPERPRHQPTVSPEPRHLITLISLPDPRPAVHEPHGTGRYACCPCTVISGSGWGREGGRGAAGPPLGGKMRHLLPALIITVRGAVQGRACTLTGGWRPCRPCQGACWCLLEQQEAGEPQMAVGWGRRRRHNTVLV